MQLAFIPDWNATNVCTGHGECTTTDHCSWLWKNSMLSRSFQKGTVHLQLNSLTFSEKKYIKFWVNFVFFLFGFRHWIEASPISWWCIESLDKSFRPRYFDIILKLKWFFHLIIDVVLNVAESHLFHIWCSLFDSNYMIPYFLCTKNNNNLMTILLMLL